MALTHREVRAIVADRLSDWSDRRSSPPSPLEEKAYAAHALGEEIERMTQDALRQGRVPLSEYEEGELRRSVLDALFGLGGLQRYLDDETIENIVVNGHDVVWVTHAGGEKRRVDPVAESDAELIELVKRAARGIGRSERRFDPSSPRLSLRLPDGSRLFAIMGVSHRPSLSIRRHRFRKETLADQVGRGTIDPTLASFLQAAVRARRNIVIAGGTDAGKTTMLRALLSAIDPLERLVIIEDLAELDLHEDLAAHPDAVSLEERDDNVEGTGRITMADLTRDALRMRPDRVIVGEVRGGEVLQMLLAMSQGNEGSLCTVHADSTATAFSRLQFYARLAPERLDDELIKRLIATSVHLVVHIARRADGRRVVTSVRAVSGTTEAGNIASDELFASGLDGGSARPTGTPLMPDLRDRLVSAGFDPSLLVTGWR